MGFFVAIENLAGAAVERGAASARSIPTEIGTFRIGPSLGTFRLRDIAARVEHSEALGGLGVIDVSVNLPNARVGDRDDESPRRAVVHGRDAPSQYR